MGEVLIERTPNAPTCVSLEPLRPRSARRLTHLGATTVERLIAGMITMALDTIVAGAAAIVVLEPIACNGAFTKIDLETLIKIFHRSNGPQILIVDTTLLGYADPLSALCGALPREALVLRLASGLKLMQAGLELANVGILSIYAVDKERLAALGADLRRAGAGR